MVRLTAAERASWHAAAAAAGYAKTATWVRAVVAERVARRGPSGALSTPSTDAPSGSSTSLGGASDGVAGRGPRGGIDRATLGALGRVGSNLNQAVRALNLSVMAGGPGGITPGQARELAAAVEDVRRVLEEVRDELRAAAAVGPSVPSTASSMPSPVRPSRASGWSGGGG